MSRRAACSFGPDHDCGQAVAAADTLRVTRDKGVEERATPPFVLFMPAKYMYTL